MLAPLETVRLVDPTSRAEVVLAPARGGMVTRFAVEGRSILYLDEATLVDPTKNVRGGNPVLFPSPGPLAGDRFTWRGRSGALKQHGFARNLPWSVVESSGSQATLALRSDDATRAAFPWDFALAYTYALRGRALRIDLVVENHSTEPMPFAVGFHPYFFVRDGDKAAASVPTRATRAWDNVSRREIPLAGPLDLTAEELDLHLLDHGASEAALQLGDGSRIRITASSGFRRWVVWTLRGKDFVCLEPWTAGANALNDEGAAVLLAGARADLWTEIALC